MKIKHITNWNNKKMTENHVYMGELFIVNTNVYLLNLNDREFVSDYNACAKRNSTLLCIGGINKYGFLKVLYKNKIRYCRPIYLEKI